MWLEIQTTAEVTLKFELDDQEECERLKKLVGPHAYCKSFNKEQKLNLARCLEHLLKKCANVEAEWSAFWQELFFRSAISAEAGCPAKASHSTTRFLQDRTQRIIFANSGTSNDSRYPPIVSHQARPSVLTSPEPWEYYRGKHGGSSGYAYSDISYRVDCQDWIDTLTKEDRSKLNNLPLMRLHQSFATNLPPLLLCEVKPAVDTIDAALNYLALQAATMQHERLKLCWLGRSTNIMGQPLSYMKKPSYCIIHLLTLVNHTAYHFICRLRPVPVKELREGKEINVVYEIVFQQEYDLAKEYHADILVRTLNKIHAINNTIGHDAQLSELKAALDKNPINIPDQFSTFVWKREALEAVLVMRCCGKHRPGTDVLEVRDLEPYLEQAEKADSITPSLRDIGGITFHESISDGRALLPASTVSSHEDPGFLKVGDRGKRSTRGTSALSPRRTRSGLLINNRGV